jgi:hypothetical protein
MAVVVVFCHSTEINRGIDEKISIPRIIQPPLFGKQEVGI